MRRMLVALISLTMVLGACGKSDSNASKKDTTTTSASKTSTTIPPAAADKAKAQTIILTQADAGAGYKASEDDSSGNGGPADESDKAFEKCSQGNAFLNKDDDSRDASSDFNKDEFTSIGSDADFATSEADAKSALDVLSNDAILQCMADAFKQAMATEVDDAKVQVTAQAFRKPVPAGVKAEQATAMEVAFTIKGPQISIPVFFDLVVMRKSRAVVTLYAVHAQTAFPQSETARLSAILSTRLAAA